MKQYLASAVLHAKVAAVWARAVPVAAICHGVLVLARAQSAATGRSLLHDRRTTCLPKYMERTAYWLTAWKLGGYYRTYPAYVEDEVRAALASPAQFERGPVNLVTKGSGRRRRRGLRGRRPQLPLGALARRRLAARQAAVREAGAMTSATIVADLLTGP
jgi:hypothetical protein